MPRIDMPKIVGRGWMIELSLITVSTMLFFVSSNRMGETAPITTGAVTTLKQAFGSHVQHDTHSSPPTSSHSIKPPLPNENVKIQNHTTNTTHARPLDYFQVASQPSDSNDCDQKYGKSLISNWRDDASNVCSNGPTSVTCHYHKVAYVENLCHAQNLRLNVDQLLRLDDIEKESDETLKGTFQGACQLNQSAFQPHRFGNGGQAVFFKSFQTINSNTLECGLWYNHTVFVLHRWDTTNLYHAHEDFIHTWSAFLILDLDPDDTIIVLTDSFPMGPFTSFWDHVVSSLHGPLGLDDRENRSSVPKLQSVKSFAYSLIESHATNSKSICFSNAAFAVHAGHSPFSREIDLASTCSPPDTSLFLSFKTFLLDRLNLESNDTIVIQERVQAHAPIKVTYITRKGFLRYIQNEDQLLDSMQKSVCKPNAKCDVEITLHDFQNLTFFHQIQLARSSDILMGVHGAALTSSLYLPVPTSALIEIGHPTRIGNYHFQNIATFVGLDYTLFGGDDNLDQRQITKIVEGFVKIVEGVRQKRKHFV